MKTAWICLAMVLGAASLLMEHRMRAFQGSFHANPDYALWYGWSEMVQDLAEIRAMARELRMEK